MKKTFLAAALIALAASAIIAAAISRPPRVKNYWPEEWNQTVIQSLPDSNNEATLSSELLNNKNK